MGQISEKDINISIDKFLDIFISEVKTEVKKGIKISLVAKELDVNNNPKDLIKIILFIMSMFLNKLYKECSIPKKDND